MAVNVSDVSNLGSVAFDVTFDPSMVEFVGWSGGSVLPGCQPAGGTLCLVTEQPGRLIVGMAVTGSGGVGVVVTGTTPLIYLSFRAIQAGGSQLGFANAALQFPAVVDIPGTTWHGGAVVAN